MAGYTYIHGSQCQDLFYFKINTELKYYILTSIVERRKMFIASSQTFSLLKKIKFKKTH